MTEPSGGSESRLTILTGPMAGRELVLEGAVDNVLIGSDPSCRFHLPTPSVNPIHARLWMDASGVTVYDAGSSSGLFVNDDRVKGHAPLRNGDILWLGSPGDDDVVMIQCRLPERPHATQPPIPPEPRAAADDAEETMVLGSASPAAAPASRAAESELDALVGEPVVEASGSAGIDESNEFGFSAAPELEAEPVAFEAASEAEPVLEPVEPEPAAGSAPDEFTIQETQFLGGPLEPPVVPVPEVPAPVEEPVKFALDYQTEEPAFPAVEAEPGTFEDETGHHLPLDTEATTLTMPSAAAAPLAAEPEPQVEPEPAPTIAAPPLPPGEPPAPPPPPPKPATPPPPPPRVRPPSPPAREAKAPRVHEAAAAPVRPRAAAEGPPIGRYVLFGVGLLVLGGLGFFGVRMLGRGGATAPRATPTQAPHAATPTTLAAALRPPATVAPEPPPPAPMEEAVTIVKSPAATLAAAPSPAAGRSPAPSPSPKAAATPTPRPGASAAPTAPAGPSAEAVKAQQVAALLGQADNAAAGYGYDAAASLFEEALKLDPQNARASAGRAAALAVAATFKKTFVAGRTSVQSGKADKRNMAGFDSEDVSLGKAPDYSGRIEFEVSPRSVKPGDNYTARAFLTNDGKKSFKIGALTVTTTANGSKSGGAASPPVKEVQPQQRVALQEVPGVWQEGTTSWNLEVAVVSDRGDTFKNTVTWR